MSQISEKTRITLGVVMVLLGFASWLTVIFFQGQANAQSISDLKSKQDTISQMQTDIAVIKSEVSDIKRKVYNSD
jgi:hypothetical protein